MVSKIGEALVLCILILVTIKYFALNIITIQASPLSFDKNAIVCDNDFDFKGTLSQEAIQDLLEGKGQWKGKKKRSFFADYADPSTGKLASQMIAEVAEEHQINSRVLLVKMQVESSSAWNYRDMNQPKKFRGETIGTQADWVMAFGLPDKGKPKVAYKGFYNQIDAAANSLAAWFADPSRKGWPVGRSHSTSDGTVNPANRATASLYIYTPWIGEGDPTTTQDDFANKLLYNVWVMMFGTDGGCVPVSEAMAPPARITTATATATPMPRATATQTPPSTTATLTPGPTAMLVPDPEQTIRGIIC